MTDPTFDPAALRALLDAATPGPWEPGDPWITAGLMFNATREVVPTNLATHCTACHHGQPVWSGRRNINGRVMAAHVHRMPEPIRPEHYIAGPPGVMVAGNFDYEVGGVINPEDTALIVAMRNQLPALLDALAAAREELAELHAESRRLGDQANHLVQQVNAACVARQRIAEAHHKHVDGHGGTWGECNECGNTWPCPTYVWATTNRDPLSTWDPADDVAAVPGDGEQAATTSHARTTHGHVCCAYAIDGNPPRIIAKCGGPLICTLCGEDKARIHTALPTSGQA